MRPLSAVVLALLINALLFWIMGEMVAGRGVALERNQADLLMVDFVRLQPEPEAPPPVPREALDEPPPQTSAPVPKARRIALNKADVRLARWEMPAIDIPLNIGSGPYLGGFRLEAVEMPAAAVPLVRVAPQYPQRALMRRKEGNVRVAFTINPDGSVSDARVIEAQPPGYFEQAALRAIRHWKFQPQLQGGVAVARQATQTISFTLKQ